MKIILELPEEAAEFYQDCALDIIGDALRNGDLMQECIVVGVEIEGVETR